MPQNDQTHLNYLEANAARFLKFVWPFWDVTHEKVNIKKVVVHMFQKTLFSPLLSKIKKDFSIDQTHVISRLRLYSHYRGKIKLLSIP